MEMTWIETLRLLGLDLLALLLLALIGRLRRARGRTHDAAPGTTAHRLSLRKPPSRHARVERATCRGHLLRAPKSAASPQELRGAANRRLASVPTCRHAAIAQGETWHVRRS
jgi:hypothetical protein